MKKRYIIVLTYSKGQAYSVMEASKIYGMIAYDDEWCYRYNHTKMYLNYWEAYGECCLLNAGYETQNEKDT